MTVYLLHGFNVRKPENTVGNCAPAIYEMGHTPQIINYGHVGLINLRPINETVARLLGSIIKPGDALITHSNGAAIAYQAAREFGLQGLSALMMLNPALDQSIVFPRDTASRIVVAYNPTDTPALASKLWRWGAYLSPLRLKYGRHLCGAAGRFGFDKQSRYDAHINMCIGPHAVKGHGGQFKTRELARYWTHKLMAAAQMPRIQG